ncbi:hypothetical protein HYV86_03975 [Candidatus Woesearchaeota archaeon]|nr:hypothetical protein [Candidatus Woesearchaeota archaeon]
MPFNNDKKTFLAKLDKSKKGSIDERAIPFIESVNKHPDLYTTSTCSGRTYFWSGSGKKNETEWIKVSHDPIDLSFFELSATQKSRGMVWLRMETFILHVCCRDMATANRFVEAARAICKKSCILTASKKIIIEIRDSAVVEMPFYDRGELVFAGDKEWLVSYCNDKLEKSWKRLAKLKKMVEELPAQEMGIFEQTTVKTKIKKGEKEVIYKK